MTQKHPASTDAIHSAPLPARMLQGAAIALVLISLFLISAGEASPDWPKL